MPVSATSEKDILRISFVPGGEVEITNPHRHEAEVVSFLQVTDAGLKIFYSHHVFRIRETTIGPFTKEITRRMPLTPALIAILEYGVFYEFWSTFARPVTISQAPIGKLPTEIPGD